MARGLRRGRGEWGPYLSHGSSPCSIGLEVYWAEPSNGRGECKESFFVKQADGNLLLKYSAGSFDAAGETHHGEGLQR